MVSQEQCNVAGWWQPELFISSGTFMEISATFPLWTFTFHPLDDTFDEVAVTDGAVVGNHLEVVQENDAGTTTLDLLAFAINLPPGG